MSAIRVAAFAAVALFGSLLGSRRVEAQEASAGKERGCRGDEMTIQLEMPFGTLVAFPVISAVPPGTPAALAGLQPGDSVVSVAGRDSREKPPKRFFAPGDTLNMMVRRQQTDVPIVLVFGRTLVEDTGTGTTRMCRPVLQAPKS